MCGLAAAVLLMPGLGLDWEAGQEARYASAAKMPSLEAPSYVSPIQFLPDAEDPFRFNPDYAQVQVPPASQLPVVEMLIAVHQELENLVALYANGGASEEVQVSSDIDVLRLRRFQKRGPLRMDFENGVRVHVPTVPRR